MKLGRGAYLVWLAVTLVGRTAVAQSEGEATGGEEPPPPEMAAPSTSESRGNFVAPRLINKGALRLIRRSGDGDQRPTTVPGIPGNVVEPRLIPLTPARDAAPAEDAQEEAPSGPAPGEGVLDFHSKARLGRPSQLEFAFSGEYALRIVGQSDIELSDVPTDRTDPDENIFGEVTEDSDPNMLGQNFYMLHWIRWRPEFSLLGRARLVIQADMLHGHIAGDDTQYVDQARDVRAYQEGVSAESIRLRHFYLEMRGNAGILRLGQMGSNWGMGLLANNGDRSEDYLFGDHRYGDIVERFVFLTKPFYRMTEHPIRELAMFIGGDLVLDDGTADLTEGDLAIQFVFGLLWRLDPERALGLYIAYRHQEYADGDELQVTAIDVYGQWSLRLAHQVSGYIEGELVGILGHTNAAPNLNYTDLDVRQLGFSARVGLRLERFGLDIRVEGGYASGDADTNDDRVGRFTFDPDYRVGLIIFQELMGWSTARAAVIASHPELVGQPQDGVDLLPTNGSVAGASYVYPSIAWSPLTWLDVRLAVLIAQATSDVISPFETKRRGRPASYRGGQATNRDLGFEIDLGVYARFNLDYFQLRAGVEGAYCIPGRAFDDAEGERMDDIGLVRGRLQFDW